MRGNFRVGWIWRLGLGTAISALLASPGHSSPLFYVTNEMPSVHSPVSSVAGYTWYGTFISNLVPAVPYVYPDAIATDAAGDVYVADASADRIVEFSPSGTEIAVLYTPPSVYSPSGLTFDPQGNLYASVLNGDIVKFTGGGGAGTLIGTVPGPARNVTYSPFDGLLYVTTNPGIYTLATTPGSMPTTFISGLGQRNLRGLAFDSHGNLFVADSTWLTDTGAIYEFIGGSNVPTLFASNLLGPNEIVIDAGGNLYVAEYYGGAVDKFAPNGTYLGAVITGLNGPSGLALGSVPEPGAFSLIAAGVLLLGAAWRISRPHRTHPATARRP